MVVQVRVNQLRLSRPFASEDMVAEAADKDCSMWKSLLMAFVVLLEVQLLFGLSFEYF